MTRDAKRRDSESQERHVMTGVYEMDGARMDLVRRLQRSSHWAFTDNRTLFVWGGHQEVAGETVALPSDEIWLHDLDRRTWERREITGERPPDLSGSCGSYINGTFYVFAGCDNRLFTDEMFSCVLTQQHYMWKRVTDTKGTTPSPRSNHSCWVHRDRLIFFGGYGPKTLSQNTSSASFIVEEMTWGQPPTPRSHHASAILGNNGYISGGVVSVFTQFSTAYSKEKEKTSDHTLFMFGGADTDRNTLNDAWQFHTQNRAWTKITHPHWDKPRVGHTACQGRDHDVVVFGGSSNMCTWTTVPKSPSQHYCGDILCFQTQPYSLYRLCEDLIGTNMDVFVKHLTQLPPQLRDKMEK